jgi:hypothetical protein
LSFLLFADGAGGILNVKKNLSALDLFKGGAKASTIALRMVIPAQMEYQRSPAICSRVMMNRYMLKLINLSI